MVFQLAIIISNDRVLFLNPSKTHLPYHDQAACLLPLQLVKKYAEPLLSRSIFALTTLPFSHVDVIHVTSYQWMGCLVLIYRKMSHIMGYVLWKACISII